MKRITLIIIILAFVFILGSMIYELATLFLTANSVFYIACIVAIYLAYTGAKKDLEKKMIN